MAIGSPVRIMRLEENRRKRQSLTLMSTFRMTLVQRMLEGFRLKVAGWANTGASRVSSHSARDAGFGMRRAAFCAWAIRRTDGWLHALRTCRRRTKLLWCLSTAFRAIFHLDPTFAGLVDAVCCVTTVRRGYSDPPDVVMDQTLNERQLLEPIDARTSALALMLVSTLSDSRWGAVAVGFTARSGARRWALVHPADAQRGALGRRLLCIPLLGEWIFARFAEKLIVAGFSRGFRRSKEFN